MVSALAQAGNGCWGLWTMRKNQCKAARVMPIFMRNQHSEPTRGGKRMSGSSSMAMMGG